jgi:hypothetical protein
VEHIAYMGEVKTYRFFTGKPLGQDVQEGDEKMTY